MSKSRLHRLGRFVLPARASTHTWMFLTFALFVGAAVVVVALYVAFMLRTQMQEAMDQSLVEQAERIAILVEEAETLLDKQQVARDISRLTDLDVTVANQDSVLWDVRDGALLNAETQISLAALKALPERHVASIERPNRPNSRGVYIKITRPESGLIMRIVQPEPRLFRLVRTMQLTLLVGMVLALVMALIGSWIASDKITRPLRTIRKSAYQISEGQVDGKIRVDTRSTEIQDLAQSLNHMSSSYREKIDELERLARLQSEFIGNVSHEVRNPIFAISGYLEALSSPRLDDAMRKRYAEKGLINLQRLQNLFNDLIEIAQLEYREDMIKSRTFDLQELLEEVIEMLRPKAEEKGLHLAVDNPPLMVHADRNRIRQVLVNLIENAIAYSDEGTVRCRFRRRLDKVRIEVVDNGRGIPEDHLDRIFERFYRVDPDRSRKSGGTGLGLSIVKQILQAHGEPIHVESTLGRGTRFWFELAYAGTPAEVAFAE